MALSGMRLRVLSAVVLALPVLLSVYIGFPAFDAIMAVAALAMIVEWDQLNGSLKRDMSSRALLRDTASWVLAIAVMSAVLCAMVGRYDVALGALPIGGLALYAVARAVSRQTPLLAASGVIYIGVPVIAMVWLRHDGAFGMASIFWLLAVVWATDTAALFCGRAIGGPKLAPSISPNKTWSGFSGGLAGAAGVSLVAAIWAGVSSVSLLIAAGVVLSVAAQLGDLLESRGKRYLDVKDSGTIIPSHGGIFDRVDGLLTAAPALALVYLLAGGGGVLWR